MQQAAFKYINYLEFNFTLLVMTLSLMQKHCAHDVSKHMEDREGHSVYLHIKICQTACVGSQTSKHLTSG